MPLTPEQKALREAAKAATPGPWHAGSFDRNGVKPTVYAAGTELRYVAQCVDFLNVTPTPNEANARFIAAANPAAILALLAQLEAREAPPALNPEPWTDEERERFRASLKLGPRCPVCTVIEPGQHFPGCSRGTA